MPLSEHDVLSQLLSRELVRPQAVVDGGVEVVGASQRNRNFKIINHAGPSYFLKQGTDPERIRSIAREAAAYAILQGAPGLDRYLPRLCAYDPQEAILVLDYVRGAVDLREYHATHRRFPVTQAKGVGAALAALHGVPAPPCAPAIGAGGLPDQVPWALSVHRPALTMMRDMSRANVQLMKVIQSFPELGGFLDALRREWKSEAIIHSDLKWDNCIVAPQPESGRMTDVRIVDWELAASGDPCWDTGSVFHAYLSYWLLSIPIMGEQPPEKLLPLARFPLERMQPAMRAFWESYAARRNLAPDARDDRLLRSVRYAAARLLQTAYEQMQASMAFTGNIVCILQLSLNMLQRPHEASVQLLGIPAATRAWDVARH